MYAMLSMKSVKKTKLKCKGVIGRKKAQSHEVSHGGKIVNKGIKGIKGHEGNEVHEDYGVHEVCQVCEHY